MSKSSWIKDDDTPIWWPPKLDDLYDSKDHWKIKCAKAFGGWLSFIAIFGLAIFAYGMIIVVIIEKIR